MFSSLSRSPYFDFCSNPWVTLSSGSPDGYTRTALGLYGVAEPVTFHWSRSGNFPVTYSSHYVYLSGHSTQIEPYQANGVANDHLCGRGV